MHMPVVRVLEAGWPHKRRSGEELIGRGFSLADWGPFPLGRACPRDARRSPLREELVKWMMDDYHHHRRLWQTRSERGMRSVNLKSAGTADGGRTRVWTLACAAGS